MSGGESGDDSGVLAGMSVGEFLARARAMELEAEERYRDLADQMEVHNNPEVADLFRRLAAIEGKHARHFDERAGGGTEVPDIPHWKLEWPGLEAPETASADDVHYLMTPHHAQRLALAAERRAHAFFANLAEAAAEPRIREMAAQFAEEEGEHVRLVQGWLARYPEPEPGWDEDPDPPVQPF
jgi:rubrerythrin